MNTIVNLQEDGRDGILAFYVKHYGNIDFNKYRCYFIKSKIREGAVIMLKVGDRVKYKEVFFERWNSKEKEFYAARRGVLTKVYDVSGAVKWDDGPQANETLFDLEKDLA